MYKGEVEEAREKLNLCPDARFRTIFTFLYDENLKIDLFSQFNIDKYFELRIVSVDSKFRGQGIAKRLFQEAENLAREVGAKVKFSNQLEPVLRSRKIFFIFNYFFFLDNQSRLYWCFLAKMFRFIGLYTGT